MKNVLYMPTTIKPRTTLELKSPGARSTAVGIIGFLSRVSRTAKAMSRITAPTTSPSVCAEVHPYSVELTMA